MKNLNPMHRPQTSKHPHSRSLSVVFRCCLQSVGMAMLMMQTTVGRCCAAPDGWQQIWSDEFEGEQLDREKWETITTTTPYNREQQAYHPSQVRVADGSLILTADQKAFGDKAFTSGKVVSRWARRYGRWEVRAKLPGTRGTWPAIWLLPDTSVYRWPSQGEIDIIENRGDRPRQVSSAFHYGTNPPYKHFYKMGVYDHPAADTTTGDTTDTFHSRFQTYAAEWDAEQIRFYVDDEHFWTLRDNDVDRFLADQTAPMQIILNVAVGGTFLNQAQPDETSAWPQRLLVDYVRVFERTARLNRQQPPAQPE